MDIVVPAILPASAEELSGRLSRLPAGVRSVQIDVVDGIFAEPPTWPYASRQARETLAQEAGWLRDLGDFAYEIDLMVERPEETAGLWVAAGASRLVLHIESVHDVPGLMRQLAREYGYEKGFAPDLLSVGLALNPDTDTAALLPHLDSVDFVQFMGIKSIGRQGQPFDPGVVDKIRAFHKAHPDVPVQVDGGVSLESAPRLLSAGASRLVVGSALWKTGDSAAELARFARIAEEQGIYGSL